MRLTRSALCSVALCLATASPVAAAPEPSAEVVPGRRPATPEELERYAEREQQDRPLEDFQGGRRGGGIEATTIVIVLLVVILVLILV